VGQNYGPIFRRLWTKVHWNKYACVHSLQCRVPIGNMLFRAGDVRVQVVKLYESMPKYGFWAAKFPVEGATQISDRIL